jgi:glycosyltransferase involved in cell wall biosynthesis
MRVALVYNDYPGVSGESVFFRNMAKEMEGRGFDICPVAQAAPSGVPGFVSHYFRHPLLRDTRKALEPLARHEVIHFLNSPLAAAGKGLDGPGKIASAHFFVPSYVERTGGRKGILGAAEKAYSACSSSMDRDAFLGLDRLVACSPFLERDIREEYGLENTEVIYPGIDTAYFEKVQPVDLHERFKCEEAIVCMGRLSDRAKAFSDLIRALSLMNRKAAKLIIIGDGPDRGRYEALAKKLGVARNVIFTGALAFGEKSSMQKSADVVAIPSRYEAYGTVFAESLACHVPVVAYDMPFWEGMYGGAGLFVWPRPEALAQGIARMLDEKDLRKKVIGKGAELVPFHSFKRTAERYAALYEEVASKRGGR